MFMVKTKHITRISPARRVAATPFLRAFRPSWAPRGTSHGGARPIAARCAELWVRDDRCTAREEVAGCRHCRPQPSRPASIVSSRIKPIEDTHPMGSRRVSEGSSRLVLKVPSMAPRWDHARWGSMENPIESQSVTVTRSMQGTLETSHRRHRPAPGESSCIMSRRLRFPQLIQTVVFSIGLVLLTYLRQRNSVDSS